MIDWERAGIYPAAYDLAFLWYTTADVPDAQTVIEAAVPDEDQASFLLSALLITLLHFDRGLDADQQLPGDRCPDCSVVDHVIAQLDAIALEGSRRA